MSKKVKRVQYNLNSQGISSLQDNEIKAIIRGADELIACGGRSLLAKILKGSKVKKIIELQLDRLPVYGFYSKLTIPEITKRIDWCIEHYYLDLEYDYKLPLLCHTPKGLQIAQEIRVTELLTLFDSMLANDAPYDLLFLKNCNKKTTDLLLKTIQIKNMKKYIPLLKNWSDIAFKKTAIKINAVIRILTKQ